MGSALLGEPLEAAAPAGARMSGGHFVARVGFDGDGARSLDVWRGEGARASISRRSGQATVVFDGLLYERGALAASLQVSPEASDADLVSTAYGHWGADFAARLRGLFALVVLDAEASTAIAVRDPLGAYPLFYARAGGDLVCSTSIDALLAQPGVARGLNRAALADHLCHRWPDQHETFFAAIARVPPGYLLRAAAGGTTVGRYWEPVPADRGVSWIEEDELQDRFGAAFERAVERALDSGPTGLFLSGGLDSISVGAVATDIARRRGMPPPFALSLGFPGDAAEETEQTGVARSLGLEQELVPFERAVPGGLLERALALSIERPAPLLNTWLPGYVDLTERAKRRGIHGILSGAGGDEWLGVTPALAADLVRAGDVRQLARLVRGWRQSYELTPVQVLRCLLWRYSARPLASAALDRMAPGLWKANRVWRSVRSTLPWIAPAPALRRELDARIDRFLPSPRPSTGFYLQDVRASLEHTLTSMELEEIFETGRRLHVRFLHPYWDADVVDILYRTPPLLLFSGGRSKSVVRQIMARRFPGLGLEHQKKRAGTTFYRSVLHREIPALWARRGSLDALGDLGVVEPGQATAMATKSIAENFGTGLVRIWDLVNVESWIRAHQ